MGRYLAEHLGWPLSSDIDPLLDLKQFHRNRENGSPPILEPRYWPEFGVADQHTVFERFQLTLHKEGFDVDAPEVWDEALKRCVWGFPVTPILIEFARGSDVAYRHRYGILEQDVYSTSFRNLPIEPTDNVFVIELFCTLTASHARNRIRRQEGERAVSDRSMSRIHNLNPLENGGRERALETLRSLTHSGWSDYWVVYNDRSAADLIAATHEILVRHSFCETD